MYDELIKRLREATGWKNASVHYSLMNEAADAIEDLNKEINKWQEIAYDWRDEYYHLLDNTPPLKATTETLKEEA